MLDRYPPGADEYRSCSYGDNGKPVTHRRPSADCPKRLCPIATINDLQLELPALKRHQHAAEVIPRDFLAIDHEGRCGLRGGIVPVDSSAYRLRGDLGFRAFAREVPDREHATESLDQSLEQPEQIVLGIADHLALIA